MAQTPPSSPLMEAMDSNEKELGFKDIKDDIASIDMAQGDLRRPDVVAIEVEGDHKVVKETTDLQLNGSTRDSLNSTTRTRIINFSHNGYSEEMFKISQHTLEKSKKVKTTCNGTLVANRRDVLKIRKLPSITVINKEDTTIKRITNLKKERKA
ncbi:hypothetical protein Cgig2_030609 [Carnegiea gigantea]|uniref:Uncharacterized protein n=1 Tax=Carnegiea gigantea TaxID=171969 RepID=A0A9Q1GR26_9CARY|nr:hypothetical protein Cgig2_030609 [Carnegiea gigantea]